MAENHIQYEWHRVIEARTMGIHFVKDGGLELVSVNGKKICLARKGQSIFAIADRCPHAGGPLHQGIVNEEGNIVCPWHRIAFCPETGKDAKGEGYAAKHYPLEIREDGIYIGMEKRKRLFGLF